MIALFPGKMVCPCFVALRLKCGALQALNEFGKLAMGPPGSVVRVRTISRTGARNIVSITRLSNKTAANENAGATHESSHCVPSSKVTEPQHVSTGSYSQGLNISGLTSVDISKMIPSHSAGNSSSIDDGIPGLPGCSSQTRTSNSRKYPAKAFMQVPY